MADPTLRASTATDLQRPSARCPAAMAARLACPASCSSSRSVRDGRGSADLCALDRELPARLAQRPPLRRLHRRAGAAKPRPAPWCRNAGAADPRQHRRARGGDEDGHAAPPARGLRHAAARSTTTSTCATCRWRARSSTPSARCSTATTSSPAGDGTGADGRRVRRDRHRRGAAAQGDAALFAQHPADVAADLRHHRARWSISRCIICSCGRCAASPPT